MTVVDTHVHVGLDRYVPLDDLLRQMDDSHVDKAVLVQYVAGHPPVGNTDNRYIAQCIRRYPNRLAAVCIIDWRKEDASRKLEYWVERRGIQGIRMPGTARTQGENKYTVWEKAAELGISVSVNGELASLVEVAERFPSLKLHIEHTGIPNRYGDYVLKLAKYSNVWIKFSTTGLREFSHEPYPHSDTHSFFKRVYDTFGPKRIMWGSNFPPCLKCEGYDRSLDFLRKEISYLSDSDKEWILGKTALKVWRFEVV